ncbi:unnamed protein product [Lactuca virosa]|uniref:Uncharacterized protein n=1 Tax=Lactuca virosa TaxID=75947 RepID=A0AAU9NQF1_9ASTR|nr:unnamed protein product [Lactuca virosa]
MEFENAVKGENSKRALQASSLNTLLPNIQEHDPCCKEADDIDSDGSVNTDGKFVMGKALLCMKDTELVVVVTLEGRHGSQFENGRHAGKYLRYNPDD